VQKFNTIAAKDGEAAAIAATQADYTKMLKDSDAHGKTLDNMPPTISAAVIPALQQMATHATSVAEQITAKHQADVLTETARHNKADEKTTASNVSSETALRKKQGENIDSEIAQREKQGENVDSQIQMRKAKLLAEQGKKTEAANLRNAIVQGAATNAKRMLGDIDKNYGDQTVSNLFGAKSDGVLSNIAQSVYRGAQGTKQQMTDTKWAGFIDEAIPVFTGGLRGNDAFRKFLMDQAPRAGDSSTVRKAKIAQFNANINGVSDTFARTFAKNPAYWGKGETPVAPKSGVTAAKPANATDADWAAYKQAMGIQ